MTRIASWRTLVLPEVRDAISDDVARIIDSGLLRGGPHTRRLEDRLGADWNRHAVVVGSGMDALELVLEDLDLVGRPVLVPANCFVAIPGLIARLGGIPVPVPVDPVRLAPLIDPDTVSGRAVVIWIHHGGMLGEHTEATICALRARGCLVIEDCAYLLPSPRPGSGPGAWGDVTIMSFAPTKPICGSGGGAVLTRDEHPAKRITARRSHSGQEHRWAVGDSIYRFRGMSEIEAVIAYHQWEQRELLRACLQCVAETYQQALPPAVVMPGRTPQATQSRYAVNLPHPMPDLRERLARNGVASTVMFDRPWFDYPTLAVHQGEEDWGEVRDLLVRTLFLPFHPSLSTADCMSVVDALKHCLLAEDLER